MRRPELIASVAVVLYIVFFALSPPQVVRSVLDNPFGMAAGFAGAIYVTLYKSKIVGGLLLAALVLSMSRGGREGFNTARGRFVINEANPDAAVFWNPVGTQDLYIIDGQNGEGCATCGEWVCGPDVPVKIPWATLSTMLPPKGSFRCDMAFGNAPPAAPSAQSYNRSRGRFVVNAENRNAAIFWNPVGTQELYVIDGRGDSCTSCGEFVCAASIVVPVPWATLSTMLPEKGTFRCNMAFGNAAPAAASAAPTVALPPLPGGLTLPPISPPPTGSTPPLAALPAQAVAPAGPAPPSAISQLVASALSSATPPIQTVPPPQMMRQTASPVESCGLEPYSNSNMSGLRNFAQF
jgi:predicted nucleic acid-binding Zn finger protein